MSGHFKNHIKFQIFAWIDAINRGYTGLSGDHATIPNLAYYLVTDGDYREERIGEEFLRSQYRRPTTDVIRFVKRDLSQRIQKYPPNLFSEEKIKKTESNHVTLQKGLEQRHVQTTAYALTANGKRELDRLRDSLELKQQLIEERETVSHQSGDVKWVTVEWKIKDEYTREVHGHTNDDPIPVDKLEIPKKEIWGWETTSITVPHLQVYSSRNNDTPVLSSALVNRLQQ